MQRSSNPVESFLQQRLKEKFKILKIEEMGNVQAGRGALVAPKETKSSTLTPYFKTRI